MKIQASLFKVLPVLATLVASIAATPLATELDITATANFPPTNPLAHVVNGERNKMTLEVENRSAVNITIKSAAGSIHDPENGKLLRNTTTLPYGVLLVAGDKTVLPYTFHSEHKPGDVHLKIWLNYDDGQPSGQHQTSAYDSVVTIVEPPAPLFDIPLLLAYIIVIGLLGGIGYFSYNRFVPKSFKRKVTRKHVKKDDISAPVGPVTAAAKSYDEDWIPAHNLKKRLAKKEGVVASSGDESGAEKRKTRKASQKSS